MITRIPQLRRPPRVSVPLAYISAVAAALVGTMLQQFLVADPAMTPFLFFFPCIAIAAWVGGNRPAMLAVLLSALIGNFLFLEPQWAWSTHGRALTATLSYVAVSVVISWLCASFREALLVAEQLSAQQAKVGAALRRRETTLQHGGHMAHLGAWEIEVLNPADLNSNRLTWSDEVFRIFGYEPGRVTVTNDLFYQRTHPDDRAQVGRAVEEAIARKTPYSIEHRIVRTDGSVRFVREHAELEFDDRGVLTRMVGAVQDITESRLAESALRVADERLRAHIDNSPLAVVEFDSHFHVTRWSQQAQRLFGWTADEILGRAIGEIRWVHEEDVELVQREAAQLVSGVRPRSMNVNRNYRKDGSVVYCEWYSSAIHDAQGQLVSVLSHVLDRTERTRAEEAQREAQQRLERAQAMAHLGSWELDLATRRLTWSDEVYRIVGLEPRTQISYLDFLSAVHPEDRAAVDTAYFGSLRGGKDGYEIEHRLVRKGTDEIRIVHEKCEHVRNAAGVVVRSVGMVHDITERKRAEEALRQANAQLTEADQRKNEFMAMLSHELRNPLAPIRNSVYILERATPGGEQAKRALAVIDRQVTHMSRLIDDLLDVTRITRGKVRLQRESLGLNDIVRGSGEDLRDLFRRNGIEFEILITQTPLRGFVDRTRIAQVVGNLLQNAAKFTPKGGHVTLSLESEDYGQAVIEVRDTGAGMDPDLIGKLFQPFVQADQTIDRSRGGLGLGLALVKGLVELHGGTVSAQSEGLGKGAAFQIRLPIENLSSQRPTSAQPLPGIGAALRLLVVEDNPDTATSLKEVLELSGHAVDIAYTGSEGIQKAQATGPNVVLCDIGLPEVDGYGVARALRADPKLRGTFLIALSGYALQEDIERSREAGFHRHLAKPPDMTVLEKVLREASAFTSATP